ncbi:iron-sulfur cluster carrier protein ApbC [Aliidiomarina iranensis]|uniref:Iron-sulfur cluster carrier protein n=1 Tax=Aliidiomarina iranensis TaxID=1434071 RepID=A0A432W0C7_9GAMM|nr:iron-sulfur cluster carrier protein ApbC [Aliidiomarina iranensis]RUO22470.1 iron-sulfur cluster carrier protein ApbC [Aliidiomarina iranensis]
MAESIQAICAELRSNIFPAGFAADWLQVKGENVTLSLPFAAVTGAKALIAKEPRLQTYHWDIQLAIETLPAKSGKAPQGANFPKIKNVIAIGSGKGGVGKSAVTLSLAKALADEGARVGILDGDIYGPSLPTMLGNQGEQLTFTPNRKMLPVHKFSIEGNSLGYLVDASAAAIWRGPMASRAVEQLFFDTQWSQLDYLLVDLPPGTGDIQLTLSQNFPLTGAVIVTTPQNIALADAQKGIAMFQKVDVPVIGLVENMSYFECGACGNQERIFGSKGGLDLANKHQVPLLGQWPLTTALRESLDNGEPLALSDPGHAMNGVIRESAQQLAANAWELTTLSRHVDS